jgi:enhancing lycopene biosynthesis protein 2
MPKIGVLLSGCGVFDGAEIHESVLTLLALSKANVEVQIMAPNRLQAHVINHLMGEPSEGESRNILVEAARIARGQITDLSQVDLSQLDGLILPGGFGVAKNLCSFAFDGVECSVDEDVASLLTQAHDQGLPLGIACIAPALIGKIFGKGQLTVGQLSDPVSDALNTFGAHACECSASEVIVDTKLKRVSTPAYMLDAPLSHINIGLEKMVNQVVSWAFESQNESFLSQIPQWSIKGQGLYRQWTFDNFEKALDFTKKVGALAEESNHHPDLELGWGYVSVSLFTHDAQKLTHQDLNLALKINTL